MSYETDHYAWTREQAAELRRLAELRVNLAASLDLEHLAEEIQDMGDNTVAVVEGLIEQILIHFLKLEWFPDQLPRNHWISEIDGSRSGIDRRLRRSPSVVHRVGLNPLYDHARFRFARSMSKEVLRSIPSECPYSLTEIVDRNFIPACRYGFEG